MPWIETASVLSSFWDVPLCTGTKDRKIAKPNARAGDTPIGRRSSTGLGRLHPAAPDSCSTFVQSVLEGMLSSLSICQHRECMRRSA